MVAGDADGRIVPPLTLRPSVDGPQGPSGLTALIHIQEQLKLLEGVYPHCRRPSPVCLLCWPRWALGIWGLMWIVGFLYVLLG